MPDYNVISTDQWQISLPTDWAQQPPNPENPGQFYFESSDGTKGAYLTAYARMDPETSSLQACENDHGSTRSSTLDKTVVHDAYI